MTGDLNTTLNVLSLFAGIGGLDLGLERAGMTVVGQVEINDYCRRVLAKHWPDVPRHDDVRTAAEWWQSEERPTVDVICGGFPCQDISAAGRRAGIINGERSGLWSFMADTVRRVRPRYVLVENVPRILTRGRDGVIPAEVVAADLAALGYDLRWDCLSAAAVGAPHLRDRWFGVAYADSPQLRHEPVAQQWSDSAAIARDHGTTQPLANSQSVGRQDQSISGDVNRLAVGSLAGAGDRAGRRDTATGAVRSGRGARIVASTMAHPDRAGLTHLQGWPPLTERAGLGTADRAGWWSTEPDVGRVVDGIPSRLDRSRQRARIHALGNAVVPQVAGHVGRLIVEHAQAVAA